MTAFETSATVQEQGRVILAGVPFAPGTEVEVTLMPVQNPSDATAEADRVRQLFAALDKGRNTESVGPLRREELYDRQPAEGARPMGPLATPGALVRVTPLDDLQYWAGPEAPWEFVKDPTPFVFRVEGWLEDGHIRYGLHGPVVDGPERYRGLWCSIITRVDGSDWRVESSSFQAGFRVGPNRVTREHRHDFRNPEGTVLEGYPRVSRFGAVEVVGSAPDAADVTMSVKPFLPEGGR